MSAELDCTVADIAAPIKNALVGGPFGSNLVSKDYTDTGVPVIRGQNMGHGRWVAGEFVFVSPQKANDLSANTARPGDLIFTQRGTLGQVAVVPDGPFEKYIVSQSQMKLTVDQNKADTQFLYYLFRSPEQQAYIQTNAIQVGVPHTNLGILRGTPIRLPPIEDQQEIARILGDLDDKIELNRQINQTLEQIAQTIFKSWFVDFEPVKAKIEAKAAGQDPERAAMCAISGKLESELDQLSPEQRQQLAATAALFPDALVESELGLIPQGWEVSDFGAVSTCYDKHRIPLSNREREKKKGPIPYYGATSVMDYVDEAIFDGVYLLLGEDGSVLKEDGTPFVQYIWGKSWVNNHAHVLQGANDVSTEQLMLFISMQNISPYVTGAVQLKLNQKNMNSIPFVRASSEINGRFSELIAPLYARHRSLVEELRNLATLRDTLLPKLLSGELSVGGCEREMNSGG